MLQIEKISIPLLDTNCYIIRKNNECIIFDCGGTDELLKYVVNNNLIPKIIFLTHGHFDHISAVSNFQSKFHNIKVIALEKERDLINDPEKNMSLQLYDIPITVSNIEYKKENEIITIFDLKIKLIPTPGHTKGGCCYYIEDEKVLFSGDTLFYNSYGRYDLPTASIKDIIDSVGVKLMELPDDVIVYPGHGLKTSIGEERKHNEIVRDYVIEYGKSL